MLIPQLHSHSTHAVVLDPGPTIEILQLRHIETRPNYALQHNIVGIAPTRLYARRTNKGGEVAARSTTRHNMLVSAAELLREHGAAGTTVDAVLARSGAPRGSVYHHFPGGRNQIIAESLEFAGTAITKIIDHSLQDGSIGALRLFAGFWTQILEGSDFAAGCPVVAVAVGGTREDQQLLPAVDAIFTRWRSALTQALVDDGVDPSRAAPLATMAVASIEGAVILCRASRSTTPLDDVTDELALLLTANITG